MFRDPDFKVSLKSSLHTLTHMDILLYQPHIWLYESLLWKPLAHFLETIRLENSSVLS